MTQVTLTFDMTDEQIAAAQKRAAELDHRNLGTDDPPESYSPELAMARILASDENITHPLCSQYTDGYTAEPVS